jgi:arylsulfatase A-like enzyme
MAFGTLLAGLERFEAPPRVSRPLRADATIDATLGWLREVCRSPAFAWVHLWDPHMPYTPPAPWDRAYYRGGDPRDPGNRSMDAIQYDWAMLDTTPLRPHVRRHPHVVRRLKQRLGVSSREAQRLLRSPPTLRERAPDRPTYDALLAEIRPVLARLQHDLPFNKTIAGMLTGLRDVAYPRALYAGEVSYVDAELGRLVSTLEAWGLRKRLVVAVTADHGEGLGEHGIHFAHIGLWEEMVRVPLVVWAPGRVRPAVRADLASGLDVAPTLLRLVGLDVGPTMEGHDLLGSDTPPRDAVVTEAVLGLQAALRAGDWKLVRTLRDYYATPAFHREAGFVELYDLARDPGERVNLAATEPDRLAALDAHLAAWLAAHPPAPVSTAPRDDRLRALGYLE